MHDSVIIAENQVPSEIRKNDINLQAQLKPLPIFGLASDLTPTLRNHCGDMLWGTDFRGLPRIPRAHPQVTEGFFRKAMVVERSQSGC